MQCSHQSLQRKILLCCKLFLIFAVKSLQQEGNNVSSLSYKFFSGYFVFYILDLSLILPEKNFQLLLIHIFFIRSLDCFGNIFDGMKNESIKKMELADFLLNVCVDIANLDIMHFISHITQIFCKDLLFPE